MIKKYDSELQIIARKVKALRLKKKITQASLASQCDIDVRSIQLIEVGKMNFSLRILYALSEALEVSPCHLIDTDCT